MCLENSKVSLSLNFNRLRTCDWLVCLKNFLLKSKVWWVRKCAQHCLALSAAGLLSFRGLAESVTLRLKQWTEGQVTI